MKRILVWLVPFLLAGCRVGPHYEPPVTDVPTEWKFPDEEHVEWPCVDYWWEVFNDETLNNLEAVAVVNNPNLFVALEKVCEARALAGVAAADLYPQLNLDPSYSNTAQLFKVFLPGKLPIASLDNIPPFRIHQLQYLLPLNLSYEVDLWGKLRDRRDSACFNAESKTFAYYSAMLTLTADLASAYFQLRQLDAQIDLLTSTIETRKKNLTLTENRFNKGLVNFLDVAQAQVDLANAEASRTDSVRLRNLAEDQIAVLTGELPSHFCLEHNPLKDLPPLIPAGIPSTVLLQRPDIAEAERTMASEHALINAAYASFFPTLNLTGTVGFLSPDFSDFLKWISRLWYIGGDSSQMLFDGWRDCSNLHVEQARFLEASGTYQQTVLTAFQEVEDALTNIDQQRKRSEELQRAVEASKKATSISLNRYTQGVAIYLEVVENERLELQSEINWIASQGAIYISTVQLIKALGGAWDAPLLEAAPEEPGSCGECAAGDDGHLPCVVQHNVHGQGL